MHAEHLRRAATAADTPAGNPYDMTRIEIVSQLNPQHLAQLPQLLEAATRADGHEPLGEHKFLRLQRGEDLGAAVLAFDDAELTGYAHTVTYGTGAERRASCEFVVHPQFRRRGVGRMLLVQAIDHAHTKSARRLDLWAYNDNPASARMAAEFGFRPTRRLLHLHRHMRNVPVAPTPSGASLRGFAAGVDDETLLALNNHIFAGHPENGHWTLDDLRARMAQPWFNPADVLMVEIGGVLAGFCWLKIENRGGDDGRVGEIYVIGTLPEFQGRGLGRYLVAQALARLLERDVETAAIYVDQSNETAIRLYESSQFHYHHVDICYTRDLPLSSTTESTVVAA